MTTTTTIHPSVDQIISAVGGKPSRDGETVVIGYGPDGHLRLRPSSIIRGGVELPAVMIEGRLARRNGGRQSDLRDKLEAAGFGIR